jgi:hypothetical protein
MSTARDELEAHHVEHLQNYGALGAGNLMILCEYHHDFLGDRLDRQEIVEKLRTAARTTRKFGEKKTRIAGKTIDIGLDVPSYKRVLFFTDAHVLAWLNRATDAAGDQSKNEENGKIQILDEQAAPQETSVKPDSVVNVGHVRSPDDIPDAIEPE